MPWKENGVVELRLEFVMRALREETAFRDLCQEYGISAKTGYKWKERFLRDGIHGLEDQPRRPKHSPQQVAEDVLCEIVRIKMDHTNWGPKKIRQVYARTYPGAEAPSLSTVKRVLEKAGLVKKKRRRKSETCGRIEHRIQAQGPNELWTVDFKGWWYTVNQQRCEPLTVRDQYSRFVLCAMPLDDAKSTTVRRQFERLFECYGMPQAIRSDNGPPFGCTRAPLGLSRLSAWWVTQGITLDRIPPGRPDQNGACTGTCAHSKTAPTTISTANARPLRPGVTNSTWNGLTKRWICAYPATSTKVYAALRQGAPGTPVSRRLFAAPRGNERKHSRGRTLDRHQYGLCRMGPRAQALRPRRLPGLVRSPVRGNPGPSHRVLHGR